MAHQVRRQLARFAGSPDAGRGFAAIAGAVLLGGLALNSVYSVPGGHAAIVFNRFVGVKNQVYGEGTHVMIPFIERPILYHIRAKPDTIGSPTGSKDLQMVNITLRVLSKPDATKLPKIYNTLGTDYDRRVLPSIVNEVLKSVVAQFTAAQLITQRSLVSGLIKDRLVDRASDFNILLDDVSITHLEFGHEYNAAVEAKQVAYQEAERARFVVEKALQDKQQIIVRAEGEARAAELISDIIKDDPDFLTLRRIEAAREIAETLSRSANRVYLSSDNLILSMFNSIEADSSSNGKAYATPQDVPRWHSSTEESLFFDDA